MILVEVLVSALNVLRFCWILCFGCGYFWTRMEILVSGYGFSDFGVRIFEFSDSQNFGNPKISKIRKPGNRPTVAEFLPSTACPIQTAPQTFQAAR